jgi:hypothetical protein
MRLVAILTKSMSMPILCAISAVLRLRSSSSRTWLTSSRFMYYIQRLGPGT